jgi:hypothetical protein
LRYLSKTQGYFKVFFELGKVLHQKQQMHGTALRALYETAAEALLQAYPHDAYLPYILSVDYYLHFAIRPQAFLLNEVPKKEKFTALEEAQLNTHKYRYWVFDMPLDINELIQHGHASPQASRVAFQYNGQDAPQYIVLNHLPVLSGLVHHQ